MKTGMIGLGAMGAPMARNLARRGYLRGVYNRTAEKAQKLARELAVTCYRSPAQLASDCELIMLCVSADRDVLELVEAVAAGVRPGAVVVDCSTVGGATAAAAAGLLAERQAHFLDAPVSGGVEGAQKAALAMMVGGDGAALLRVKPVLEAVAARIAHLGKTGSGQAAKAVNQVMAAGINQAVAEALAFAERQGLPTADLISVIAGGAAGNWFLEHRGLSMTAGKFEPGFKIALHYKDLAICLGMAERFGFSLPLTEKTLADYRTLMAEGYGDCDISALYRLKQA